MKRLFAIVLLFASALPGTAADQIRLVVPFAAGGPVDLVARTIASALPARLNADVIVENRGGAGGMLGTEVVAKSPADGRTLLQASLGSHVLSAALHAQPGYDPIKSFTPIVFVGLVPSVLVVNAQSGISSFAELLVTARRGTLSYGSAGPGSSTHIAGAIFTAMAGVQTTHIPYRGAGPALNDLLGGHLDLIVGDTPALLPQIATHTVRPLALFAAERSALLPDLSTTAELGFPGMVLENWYGIFAPAGLPPALRATLETAILDVLASPAVKARLAAGGLQGTRDGEGLRQRLANDVAYWGPELKRLGISGE
jgi:tripartite-type tricarboxylate transporter receptor subunit TctC